MIARPATVVSVTRTAWFTPGAHLTNGNFDADALGGSPFKYMTPAGWRCNGDCALTAAWETDWGGGGSASGPNYLGLQNLVQPEGTAVTQTLAIPVSQQLRVSFFARYRPNRSGMNVALLVSLGSQAWNLSSLNPAWTSYSYETSLPVAGSVNLTFQNACPLDGDCTAQIDDVQLRGAGASFTQPIGERRSKRERDMYLGACMYADIHTIHTCVEVSCYRHARAHTRKHTRTHTQTRTQAPS